MELQQKEKRVFPAHLQYGEGGFGIFRGFVRRNTPYFDCFTLTVLLVMFTFWKTAGASDAASIGREIFLDTNLSRPVGQGCVSCHLPSAAFAEPRPVSLGAVSGKNGNRNAPTLMYAALIPALAYDEFFTKDGEEIFAWEGGLFHDGRARDLFEQVQKPFFNPLEMNLPDSGALATAIRKSDYADAFRKWIGDEAWKDDRKLLYFTYRALVEFLKEPLFRPFDARIDDFLKGDTSALSESEQRGFSTFTGAGMCTDCHFLTRASWEEPLLSDYGYDNFGVPSRGEKDPGLGARTGESRRVGTISCSHFEKRRADSPIHAQRFDRDTQRSDGVLQQARRGKREVGTNRLPGNGEPPEPGKFGAHRSTGG